MTAISQYFEATIETRAEAVRLGSLIATRLISRFLGVVCFLVALGMWVAPGTTLDSDLALMKLGTSFFFALIGMTLYAGSERQPQE